MNVIEESVKMVRKSQKDSVHTVCSMFEVLSFQGATTPVIDGL